jgi:hypothetical protein
MKRFIKVQIFLFVFFLCIQWQHDTPTKIFTIPLTNNIANRSNMGLKEITDYIDYIKLEFKPECALGKILKLVATEKYFFVCDVRGVYQFLRSGKFVRRIGNRGRGPGEYPSIKDISADENSQRFYILANYLKQIMIYDFDGNYLGTIPYKEDSIEKFDIIDTGMFALQTHPLATTLLTTSIIDGKGASILKFYNRLYHNVNEISIKAPIITYRYNYKLFLKDGRNDTVYNITSKGVIPYFVYNLGKYKPPLTFPSAESAKYVIIYNIFETDRFIYSFFYYKDATCVSKYNKESKETVVSIPKNKLQTGIINDFDNGANFILDDFPIAVKTVQKELLLALAPNMLKAFKEDNNIAGNFKALISRYNEGDNPVIIVIKLK